MTLPTYLFKLILVSAILFGYYRLFLCNKRFHHYNRFFLLSALLLSVVLPFIRIPLLYRPENPVHEAMYRTVSILNPYPDAEPGNAPLVETFLTWENSLLLVYVLGASLLLVLLFRSLMYIQSLRKKYPAEILTGLRFYNTNEPGTPFSFFRSVFWNEQLPLNSVEGQQIFRHELFHVRHRHSADRLLAEVLTALFWFNPFFHLIKRELKAIHEFLADQFAVSGSDRYAYATLLVQQALDPGKHAATNHFFQNHIKRRIAMITQFQQSKYGYWSRVMVLPVALLLFCLVTLYAKKPAVANDQPRLLTIAGISEESIYGVPQNGNETATTTDTLPDEEKRHIEQMRQLEEQMRIKEEKMDRMYQEMLAAKRVQLDKMEAQLKELQSKTQHVQQGKDPEEVARRMQVELQGLQENMDRQSKVKTEAMKEMMQHSELRAKEDPAYLKEHQEKVQQMNIEMETMKQYMREQKQAMDTDMKERLRLMEMKQQQQEKLLRLQEDRLLQQKKELQEYNDTVPVKRKADTVPTKLKLKEAKADTTKPIRIKLRAAGDSTKGVEKTSNGKQEPGLSKVHVNNNELRLRRAQYRTSFQ